ncbi:MAG: cytochrome c biogenesis protein CcsA [Rhodospirillaceae bacterium]
MATVGSIFATLALTASGWHTGFGTTLTATIAVVLGAYLPLAARLSGMRALAILLMPYLCLLALLSAVWGGGMEGPPDLMTADAPPAWLALHISVALGAFALLTLAAVAALAGFLQARALKRRKPTALTRRLPALAEADALTLRLLASAEAVLGLGLISGMAVEYFASGSLIVLDHKTLLSWTAFLLIGLLLAARSLYGLRGQAAARFVLLAQLLLTLAFPGVKFVSDVLMQTPTTG